MIPTSNLASLLLQTARRLPDRPALVWREQAWAWSAVAAAMRAASRAPAGWVARGLVAEAVAELDGVRQKIRRHLEQEVVELALHVARKVVRHELTVSKDTIVCVVQEAMTQLDDPGKISIRLNPDDLKKIRAAGETLSSVMDHLDTIHFEEDTGIDCGGCYIQTEYGVFELKYFFSEKYVTDDGEDVSNKKIKAFIKNLCENEPANKPYNDQKISEMLKDEGFPVARRTVAKYREQMNIPVARLRRRI